jgi:hypothetical protein
MDQRSHASAEQLCASIGEDVGRGRACVCVCERVCVCACVCACVRVCDLGRGCENSEMLAAAACIPKDFGMRVWGGEQCGCGTRTLRDLYVCVCACEKGVKLCV